jgi:hypothetical protein
MCVPFLLLEYETSSVLQLPVFFPFEPTQMMDLRSMTVPWCQTVSLLGMLAGCASSLAAVWLEVSSTLLAAECSVHRILRVSDKLCSERRVVFVSPTGTTGSLPRMDRTGSICLPTRCSYTMTVLNLHTRHSIRISNSENTSNFI